MDTQNDGLETVTPLKKWSCFGIYVAFPGCTPPFLRVVCGLGGISKCALIQPKTSMKSRYYNMPPFINKGLIGSYEGKPMATT